jgi:hypothetical protein
MKPVTGRSRREEAHSESPVGWSLLTSVATRPAVDRRAFLGWLGSAALLPACPAPAAPAPRTLDAVDAAIARGVRFLLSCQEANGGFFDAARGERDRHESALSGLAVLALAAAGHTPADRTPEGAAMKRAVDFLLQPARQDPDGYFGREDNSRMYGHGIVLLALAELLGMGADKAQERLLHDRVRLGVELTLRAQRVSKRDPRHVGGWRYTPDSADSDLSVTVWHLLALRSARNAGLPVPKAAIDLAVGYLKRSYMSTGDPRATGEPIGGFAYQPGQRPDYSMTSAGLLAMIICGHYESEEVRGAANWLRANPVEAENRWFFYGTYYYAQGMFQRGGDFALEGRRNTERLLLPRQLEDGAWHGSQGQEYGVGRIYGTALAILSLAVRNHFLPIYQR